MGKTTRFVPEGWFKWERPGIDFPLLRRLLRARLAWLAAPRGVAVRGGGPERLVLPPSGQVSIQDHRGVPDPAGDAPVRSARQPRDGHQEAALGRHPLDNRRAERRRTERRRRWHRGPAAPRSSRTHRRRTSGRAADQLPSVLDQEYLIADEKNKSLFWSSAITAGNRAIIAGFDSGIG